MRIAFVSIMAGSPWAASEVLWAEAAHLALAEGHEVLVSTFDWPERPAAIADLERRGARIDLRPLSRWLRRSATMTLLTRSFQALEAFRPDVICVSQGGTYDVARSGGSTILRRTLYRMGVPYVLMCHCEQAPPPPHNLARAHQVFKRAATVGMVAEKLRSVSEAHLGVALPNMRTFHNPVNLRRIERLPWPDQREGLRFAFVGRLDPVKNLAPLIEAFAADRWKAREWALTLYGAGPERPMLEALVRIRGLAERIRFAGYANEIAAVWATHHALILPSRLEGVPLAMIEAMLCGRPVAATDIGGISEWVTEGENGFLIAHPDRNAIGDALERLWSRRTDLENMGRVAYQRTIEMRDSDPGRTLLRWLTEAAGLCGQPARSHVNEAALVSIAAPVLSDSRPTISVVIPTFEPERFLVDAVRSVLAQDPGREKMQIAIVDDGSRTHRAADIIRAVAPQGRIEIHEHADNLGLAGNWNRAISVARGKYVHILHQDDVVLPGFYERLIAGLTSAPYVGMAFCRHAYIDENDAIERITHRERWGAGILRDWLGRIAETQRIQCPAAIVKREVYERLGGFRADLRYALDWEMWVRIAAYYEVWYEPTVLAQYRRHRSTETARLEAAGRINDDLITAIEVLSNHLPAEERSGLRRRAYQRLVRLQLRRASKLLAAHLPGHARNQLRSAREALDRLPPDASRRWARFQLMKLEARARSAP